MSKSEMKRNILLTGFRGSAAEELLNRNARYPALLLPNDRTKDAEKLIKMISEEHFDLVFSFGQRPNIKNKAHIETTAKNGSAVIQTEFDCEQLSALFTQNGIPTKLSHNAGTSYCNSLYDHGLRYIREHHLPTQMVFIHIPFMKNLDDADTFFERILDTVASF